MKFVKTIVLLCLTFLITSCDDEGLDPLEMGSKTELLGTWVSVSSEMETSILGETINSGVQNHTEPNDIETLIFSAENKGEHRHYDEDEEEWLEDKFTYTRLDNKAEGKIIYAVDEMIGNIGVGEGFLDCNWVLKGNSLVVTLKMKMLDMTVITTYKRKAD